MNGPGDEADGLAGKFDIARPNIARVYDYWPGGKDNFAADREEAHRMLAIYPPWRSSPGITGSSSAGP